MLDRPENYGLTDRVRRFVNSLDRQDLSILELPEHTLYVELMSGLHNWGEFEDPVQDHQDLEAVLYSISAVRFKLLTRLHRRLCLY